MPPRGKKVSPETRAKISAKQKKNYEDPRLYEQLATRNREMGQRPEVRAKISEALRKHYKDPAARRQRSEEARQRFKERVLAFDPENEPQSRRCTHCKKVKPVGEFYTRKLKLKSGFISIYPLPTCKLCKREEVKARREQKLAEGRRTEVQAEEKRHRETRDKKKHRDYQREWETARRREEGIAPRNFKAAHRDCSHLSETGEALPFSPIRTFIEDAVNKYGKAEIERLTGIPQRRLYASLSGEQDNLTLRSIDRLCTGLGHPEWAAVLYPPEEKLVGYRYIEQ